MRTIVALGVCLLSLPVATAEADPYTILPDGNLVYNAVVHTEGTFTCPTSYCVGSGTNTITLRKDPSWTLTFNGVDTSFSTNPTPYGTQLQLGTFDSVASGDGFTFPKRGNDAWPVFEFHLRLTQSSPTSGTRGLALLFRPGGKPSITGSTAVTNYVGFFGLPNPPGFEYMALVYSFPTIKLTGTTASVPLPAKADVAPEPATVVLVGSGLLGAIYRRRQKLGRQRPTGV
jgi:hypothetical protein